MAGQCRPPAPSRFDRLWLDFRDRYGLLWGQRVREQFNRAAHNAGWPVMLFWQGLRLHAAAELPDEPTQQEILDTLVALLQRFMPPAEEPEPEPEEEEEGEEQP